MKPKALAVVASLLTGLVVYALARVIGAQLWPEPAPTSLAVGPIAYFQRALVASYAAVASFFPFAFVARAAPTRLARALPAMLFVAAGALVVQAWARP